MVVEQCVPGSVSGFGFESFFVSFSATYQRNVCETETIHPIYSVNICIRSSQIELVLFHSWFIKRYPHLLEILFSLKVPRCEFHGLLRHSLVYVFLFFF